ncbi:hypothetical protein [Streptomyces albicerus]|uniref:hypothetical protein n=1 Tax=Streptomyces albicerus TaxID=2569859 RepID=UPI00124B2E94|nr:hypothetical protein [Streptomyces albicerus]
MTSRALAAAGDLSVLPVNAEHCRQAMGRGTGDVQVIDLGGMDHITSEQHASPAMVCWFTTLL